MPARGRVNPVPSNIPSRLFAIRRTTSLARANNLPSTMLLVVVATMKETGCGPIRQIDPRKPGRAPQPAKTDRCIAQELRKSTTCKRRRDERPGTTKGAFFTAVSARVRVGVKSEYGFRRKCFRVPSKESKSTATRNQRGQDLSARVASPR
jgi:hypothetical protein